MSTKRIYLGIAIWIAIISSAVAGYYHITPAEIEEQTSGFHGTYYYLTTEAIPLRVYFERDVSLGLDDPINFFNGKDFIVVGRVIRKVPHKKGGCMVEIEMFPDQLGHFSDRAEFYYYENVGDIAGIVDSVMSGENGPKIKKEMQKVIEQKKDRVLEILMPALQNIINASYPSLKDGITQAIAKHQDKLAKLVQKELLEKKLLPALQEEIWPIVQKKAPPVINPIARELWNQLPIGSIIGREMLHKVWLSKKSGIDRFNEYVQKKAIPTLTRNQDKLIALAKEIAADLASNPKVVAAFNKGMTTVAGHDKFKKILQDIAMEGILYNEDIKEAIMAKWGDLSEAINQVLGEVEGVMYKIADYVLCKDGDYRKGINPSLARVLRQQILWKDTRWIQVKRGEGKKHLFPDMVLKGRFPRYE